MNKAILIGNLTKDPEIRTTTTGTSVAAMTVAINRRYKDADGKQLTDFIPVVAWRKLADLCGQYLSKGKKVAIVGEIQTRQYLADDGSKRYVTEVVAEEIEFLSPAGRQTIGEDPDGFMEIAEEEFPFC